MTRQFPTRKPRSIWTLVEVDYLAPGVLFALFDSATERGYVLMPVDQPITNHIDVLQDTAVGHPDEICSMNTGRDNIIDFKDVDLYVKALSAPRSALEAKMLMGIYPYAKKKVMNDQDITFAAMLCLAEMGTS